MTFIFFHRAPQRPDPRRIFRRFLRIIERRLIAEIR